MLIERATGRCLVLLVTLLTTAACEDPTYLVMAGYSSRAQLAIDKAFAERDRCLARNAVAGNAAGSTRHQIAEAVAYACQAQTDHLIAVSNPAGSLLVAENIRRDSQFRALGYVMKAEGVASR